MTDIVERLREVAFSLIKTTRMMEKVADLLDEAADEIERLRKQDKPLGENRWLEGSASTTRSRC